MQSLPSAPEMRRIYALAADLNVPVLTHFQDIPSYPGSGTFDTGFGNFEAILKAYPKTKFIGHANDFWANISADYAGVNAYPSGKVKPGGVTDKWLTDYENFLVISPRCLASEGCRAMQSSRSDSSIAIRAS